MTADSVRPYQPERIARVEELAEDLWWSWHPEAREVFRRLDYGLWRATAHNPCACSVAQPRQARCGGDRSGFLGLRPRGRGARRRARHAQHVGEHQPELAGRTIAYFEFALHQSLPIYAGGPACSPAITARKPATSACLGVGFMYPQGYFHQHISAEGWQEELRASELGRRAIERALTAEGKPCIIAVPLGERSVLVEVWRACSARHPMLLDTSLRKTRRGIASCRRASAAIARRASSRRSSSASAASALRPSSNRASSISTKDTPVSSSAADSRSDRTRLVVRRAVAEIRRTTMRRIRRCRPGTTRSLQPGRETPGRRVGHARRARDRSAARRTTTAAHGST